MLFISVFFFDSFCFFSLSLLFCFEIMTTNAVFLAIGGGCFQKGVIICDTEKGFPAIREMFCSCFPPKPFFQKHSVCHFSFSSVIPFNIPCFLSSSISFQIIFSLCFVGSIFVAPLLSSFLLLAFQPVSCHPLLQSTLVSFLVVSLFYSSSLHDIVVRLGVSFFSCWFLIGFLLTVVVTFLFITGNSILSFSFCCVLLSKCGVGCFGFRLRPQGKRCFPCGSGGLFGKW